MALSGNQLPGVRTRRSTSVPSGRMARLGVRGNVRGMSDLERSRKWFIQRGLIGRSGAALTLLIAGLI